MNEREPNVTIDWQDRKIGLYLDDRLLYRRDEIGREIAVASERAIDAVQLKRAVTSAVVRLGLQMVTYADEGGPGDQLAEWITVGLKPQPEPKSPTVDYS